MQRPKGKNRKGNTRGREEHVRKPDRKYGEHKLSKEEGKKISNKIYILTRTEQTSE